VPYLPCGVEEILTMVRELPLRASDELVDLGSGLGKVAMLAHLLSGARTSGIEIQPLLVAAARESCARLGLESNAITFVLANAAEADVDGSVFFLYAPFNGQLLEAVLARLRQVARRRAIAVCAVGLELHGATWLRPRPTSSVALTLYESGDSRR
jgi:SAM-dependent methyltransferase